VSAEAPLPQLPARAGDAHKASVGRVLVVGGSLGMAGAPYLVARGAMRAGAGLVTIAVPAVVRDVVAGLLPEALTIGLPCDEDGRLVPSAPDALKDAIDRVDAIVVGPGLGRSPGAEEAVVRLLSAVGKPAVLDADGLYAYRMRVVDLAKRPAPTVLTPHKGEASALLGSSGDTTSVDRDGRAGRIARESGGVCVLKGPATVVTDGRRTRHNVTGGPILATAGSGDVLAGVVAAFLAGLPATGGDAFGAACLAVHVHGAAGDAVAKVLGDRGALASEIADAIPAAIRALVAGSGA
jgi:hydroxyethylthiazole kinase-like uncharacterized protein yjeF